MGPGWFQLLVVLLIVVLLFGRGKISEIMGDFAKGIKSFKHGMSDDEDTATSEQKAIEDRPADKKIDGTTVSSQENVRVG